MMLIIKQKLNYLIVLKTLQDNEDIIKYLIESNKENFTDKEYMKIEKNIYSNYMFDKKDDLNKYNGYTELCYDKIESIILYLARNTIHKTKLLIEMFLIDFKCYSEYDYSLTGLKYKKI